jgi:hypothetical protein
LQGKYEKLNLQDLSNSQKEEKIIDFNGLYLPDIPGNKIS